MPDVCRTHAGRMTKTSWKYANTYQIHVQHVPETYLKHAQNISNTCPTHARDMPETLPTHARNIPKHVQPLWESNEVDENHCSSVLNIGKAVKGHCKSQPMNIYENPLEDIKNP